MRNYSVSPIWLCITFLIPFCIFLFWHWNFPFGFVDDAYISMVYAQNIAEGYGVVFYPGGGRVEGYTNPLWVMVLTVAHVFGVSLPFTAYWLGMFCAVAALLWVILIYQKGYSRQDTPTFWNLYFYPGLAALLTVLDVAWIAWSASGLETLGYTLLLLCIAYGCISPVPSRVMCMVLFLLALMRPEGILFLPLLLIRFLFSAEKKNSPWKNVLLFVVVPYSLFLVARFLYFGFWLPNTFYAKHDFGGMAVFYRGLVYVMTFVQPRVLFLFSLMGLALERPQSRSASLWLFSLVLFHSGITILEGGDHFALHRFLVPVIPLISILTVRALQNVLHRFVLEKITRSRGGTVFMTQTAVAVAVILVVVLHAMQLYDYKRDGRFGFSKGVRFHYSEVSWAEGWKTMGKWLKETYPPQTKIAVITAGAIPFYSRLHCVDILGMNDVHIAHQPVRDLSRKYTGHEKTDADYVLSHEPEFVQLFPMLLFGLSPSTEEDLDDMMTYPAQYDLMEHPRFQSEYAFITTQTAYGYISYFERKRE